MLVSQLLQWKPPAKEETLAQVDIQVTYHAQTEHSSYQNEDDSPCLSSIVMKTSLDTKPRGQALRSHDF